VAIWAENNSDDKGATFSFSLPGYMKNEDTDMIRLFTNMDTLVQLTNRLPTSMEIQD
jgi:hypothetical protein